MSAVSIIIPAYNAEKYLAATLDSVLAQTFADWECVIVDDGSTDRTGAIADAYTEQDPRIRAVHQANMHTASARNTGITASNPEYPYVAFLDNDDIWEPDALAVFSDTLDQHPEAVGVHGVARYINSEGEPFRIGEQEALCHRRHRFQDNRAVLISPNEPTDLATLAVHNCIVCCTVMVRRSILLKTGLFDRDIRGCDDYNMWLRMSHYGPFIFVDRMVGGYRWHSNNVSGDLRLMDRNEILARSRALNMPNTTEEERRFLQLGYRLWERAISYSRLRAAGELIAQGRLLAAAHELRRSLRDYCRSLRGLPRWKSGKRLA